MSAYDHNVKAGNEGDICKHPALIAALDKTITDSVTPMRYADVFAGYATNPLNAAGEWKQGIEVVAREHLLTGNAHVSMWAEAANLRTRPHAGGTYPGSAWFRQSE
jgi:23S rRNA A2030 N6-methylase RlmJ